MERRTTDSNWEESIYLGFLFFEKMEEDVMKKVVLAVIMMLLMSSVGFADTYLSLVSSSIEDNSVEVELEPVFTLEFSNNVVNMAVKENNAMMFEMKDSEGNLIPLLIEMGDDQENRETRNIVVVKTEAPLKEGTLHTLTIKKGLKGKNKTTLEDEIVITFATLGQSGNIQPTSSSVAMYLVYAAVIVAFLGFVFRKRNKK